MIAHEYRLTLLKSDGSEQFDKITKEELDRKIMTPVIRSWVSASSLTLQSLFIFWSGKICACYASSDPTGSDTNYNSVASKAYAEFLNSLEGDQCFGWSPPDGRIYGSIVIAEDVGIIKNAPPARSSEELLSRNWFDQLPTDGRAGS